jgi:8-oxo-dGTP pyrophosphatase MutT (NUDIX family)
LRRYVSFSLCLGVLVDNVHMDAYRKQVAALPWRRRKGRIEVLLITSRETKRWVVPKGWPMEGVGDSQAAGIEAYEEAGVEGDAASLAFGSYDYVKRGPYGDQLCRVSVYPLQVRRQLRSWPEVKERSRRWHAVGLAADRVNEVDLAELIRSFGFAALRDL